MSGTKPLSRIRLKYVHPFIDRHGKPRHYFRRGGCKLVPLPGLPGSAKYMAAYAEALSETPRVEIGAARTLPGTINAMIVGYLSSTAFHKLASASSSSIADLRSPAPQTRRPPDRDT